MTINDYYKVMTRLVPGVKIAALKARLSHYLRIVRRGTPLTVLDRDTPVARLVPFAGRMEGLRVRRALRSGGDVRLPAPLRSPVDSLALLLEDRNAR